MKFKNAAIDTILFVDEKKFATLKDVTPDYFSYQLQFDIDINEAISKNNTINGKIFLYKNKKSSIQPIINIDKLLPNKPNKFLDNKGNLANKTIIDNLLSIQTIRKTNLTKNDENIFYTKSFSILDNLSLKDLEDAKKNKFQQTVEINNLSTIDQRVTSLKESKPNYNTNLTADSLATSKIMLNFLKENKDPAILLQRTNGIKNLNTIKAGTVVNYSNLNLLQKSIIEQNSNKNFVSNQTIVSEIVKLTTTKKTFIVNLEIDKRNLENFNELFFEIELYDENGRPTTTKEIVVNHKKLYDIFTLPKFAPKIVSAFRSNTEKLIVNIKQVDKLATDVLLYYKELNSKNQKYYFLGKYSLLNSDGEKKFEINKLLNKKIILRAFSEFNDSKKGLLFDSVILDLTKTVTSQEFLTKKSIANTWNYEIKEDNSIVIDCVNEDENLISAMIFKLTENQTNKQLIFGPTKIQNNFISFKDVGNKKDISIQYYIEYIKKDGTKIPGVSVLDVYNKEIKTNILNTQINNQKNSINSNQLNVEFDLSTTVEKNKTNLVIDVFKQQGVYDLFKDNIKSTDLNVSFVHRILRTNNQTGDEADFGIVLDSKFNDSVLGKKLGITPIEAGYKYTYKVFTYFRTPSTLIPNLEVNVNNSKTEYTYLPYYSRHPYSLKYGTIVTENSIKEQHAETDFSFGPSSEIIQVEADFTNILPSIKETLTLAINENENLISWIVDGNTDKIDHFIILLNQLGNKKICGAAHAVSDSNRFEYLDILNKEKGQVSYSIIPVYFDYSLGQEIITNTIII